jgi:hypothetical protein
MLAGGTTRCCQTVDIHADFIDLRGPRLRRLSKPECFKKEIGLYRNESPFYSVPMKKCSTSVSQRQQAKLRTYSIPESVPPDSSVQLAITMQKRMLNPHRLSTSADCLKATLICRKLTDFVVMTVNNIWHKVNNVQIAQTGSAGSSPKNVGGGNKLGPIAV